MQRAAPQVRRLFFALQPDDVIAARLIDAARVAKARGLFSNAGRPAATLHMTVHFLGTHSEYPEALVRDALAAAATFRFAPFEFLLDRVDTFDGSKPPCVLRCTPRTETSLRKFHVALVDALSATSLRAHLERREFEPHVTIAYAVRTAETPLPIDPIEWRVREFVLLESLVGRSIHNRLGVWPLVG